MSNGGRIDYTIGYNVDRSGLNTVAQDLKQIQNMTVKDLVNPKQFKNAENELAKIKSTAADVELALQRSFDVSLGATNISKLNQELKNLNVKKIYQDFSKLGVTGQNAFRNLASEVLTTNVQLKKSNEWLTKIGDSMANTIRWGLTSGIWNNMVNSLSRAFGFAKSLDSSLNDIRIVTGQSVKDMKDFAVEANKAAKELGTKTTDYTKGALTYYQQGLSAAEVQARTETTLKASNVTGLSTSETADLLTSVWNGYNVTAQETEKYVDKLTAVAATSASNLSELATGMSKVASAANVMGVNVDQLNAQLATVISVTRQAPENVGTAFKTIYARMADIKSGLDEETTLGAYSGKMAQMGINVLDATGNIRDMGDVIEEVGNKWSLMTREQQISLAQTMAGARQYNNLLSLFDHWNMYQKELNVSLSATGALQEQQDIYMESVEAHLNNLSASTEGLFNSLLKAEDVNPVIDALSGIVGLVKNFSDSIGGAQGAVLLLGNVFMNTMQNKIDQSLTNTITNFKTKAQQNLQAQAASELIQQFGPISEEDNRFKELIGLKKELLQVDQYLSDEEKVASNNMLKSLNDQYKQQDVLNDKIRETAALYEQLSGRTTANADVKKKIENPFSPENLLTSSYDQNQKYDKQFQQYRELAAARDKQASKMNADTIFANYKTSLEQQTIATDNLSTAKKNLETIQNELNQSYNIDKTNSETMIDQIKKEIEVRNAKGENIKDLQNKLKDLTQIQNELNTTTSQQTKAEQNVSNVNNKIKEMIMLLKEATGFGKDKTSQLSEEGLKSIYKAIGGNKIKATTAGAIGSLSGTVLGKEGQDLEEYIKNLSKDTSEMEKLTNAFKILQQELKQVNTQAKKMTSTATASSKQVKMLDNGVKNVEASLKSIIKTANTITKNINKVTSYTNIVMKFGMAIQSVKQLPNIWANNDLSTGEKLLQTLMSLSMIIPNLISGFSKLASVTGLTGTFASLRQNAEMLQAENVTAAATVEKLNQEYIKLNSITNLTQGKYNKLKEAIQAEISSNEILSSSVDKAILQEEIKKIAKENNIKVTKQQTELLATEIALTNANTAATEAGTAAKEGAAAAQMTLNNAFKANPIGLVITLVTTLATVLMGVFSIISNIQKKQKEQRIETLKESLELLKQKEEEINKTLEIKDAYESLIESYKNGNLSQIEMYNSVKDLNKEYGTSIDLLPILKGNIDDVTESLKKQYLQQLANKQQTLEEEITKSQDLRKEENGDLVETTDNLVKLVDKQYSELSDYEMSYGYIGGLSNLTGKNYQDMLQIPSVGDALVKKYLYSKDGIDNANSEENFTIAKIVPYLTNWGDKTYSQQNVLFENLKEQWDDISSLIEEWNKENVDNQIDLDDFKNTDLYKDIDAWITNYETTTKDEREYIEERNKALLSQILGSSNAVSFANDEGKTTTVQGIDLSQAINYTDFENKLNDIKQALTDVDFSYTDTQLASALSSISMFGNVGLNLQKQDYLQQVTDMLGEDFAKIGDSIKTTINDMSQKAFEEFLSSGGIGSVPTIFNNLANDLKQIYVNNMKGITQSSGKAAAASAIVSDADVLLETLQKGEDIITSTDETVKEAYNSLKDEFVGVGNLQSMTNEQQIRFFEQLKEQQEDTKFYNQREEYEQLLSALNTYQKELGNGKNEEERAAAQELYNKTLEQTIDLYRELQETKTADLVSDLEDVTRKAKNAASAISKIKDGFKVEGSDVEELLNLFPELAYKAQVAADGTLLLNDEIVKSVLGGVGEEIDAYGNLAEANVQNRLLELEAEEEKWKHKLKLLESGAASETEINEILSDDFSATVKANIDESNRQAIAEQTNANNTASTIISGWAAAQQAALDYGATVELVLDNKMTAARQGAKISSTEYQIREVSTYEYEETQDKDTSGNENQATEERRRAAIEKVNQMLKSIQEQRVSLLTGLSAFRSGIDDIQDVAEESLENTNELLDEQIDRYHDINVALQNIENTLTRLSNAEDKYFGKSLIANLQKQTKEMEKQLSLQKQKQAMQYAEASEIRGKLKGYGVTFNGDDISNYTEVLKKYQDMYNSLASAGVEGEALDNAQTNYDNLKEYIERYEQLYQEDIPNLYDEMLENEFEKMDKLIQAYNEQMQIKLDAKQAIRDLNAWSDDVFDSFKTFNKNLTGTQQGFKAISDRIGREFENVKSYYTGTGEGTVELNYEKLQKIMRNVELMNKKDVKSDYVSTDANGNLIANQTKAIEDLNSAEEELKTSMSDLYSEAERIIESWNEAFNGYISRLEDLINEFEFLGKEISHYQKVNEILYGKSARRDNTFNQAQIQINANQIKAQTDILKTLESTYNKYLAAGNDEQARLIKEKIIEQQESINSLVENNLTLIKDNVINQTKSFFEDLELNALSQQEWDLAKENQNDRYDKNQQKLKVDALEAKIEKDKLKYTEAAQKRLSAFQQKELKFLKEKDTLTKHDYERAQKRYDLLLKQIALEESQNNKSKMRLRRDSQGNYSYQYVADESDDNTEEVKNALEELYTFDKEYFTSMSEALQKMLSENAEELSNAIKEFNQSDKTEQDRADLESVINQIAKNYGLTINDYSQAKQYLLNDLEDLYSSAGDLISQNGLNPSIVSQMLGVSREILEQMTAKELVDGLNQSNEGANLLISNIYGINDSILEAGDSIISAYNEGMFSAEALGEKADEILANIQNQMKITVENGHQDNQLISGDLDVISDQLNEMISESQEIVDEIYNANLQWAAMAEELNGILSTVTNIINEMSNSFIPKIQSAIA